MSHCHLLNKRSGGELSVASRVEINPSQRAATEQVLAECRCEYNRHTIFKMPLNIHSKVNKLAFCSEIPPTHAGKAMAFAFSGRSLEDGAP